MTAATTKPDVAPTRVENPEEYRMSIGEHLEELRWRLILGLGGFIVVFLVCLFYGDTVVAYFCRPLLVTLKDRGLPTTLFSTKLTETFMISIKIAMISAAAIASPWLMYQIWQFVAAGLYPHERKWVTKYSPLSIGLLVGGMSFMYFLVLPWTCQFFIDWAMTMPMQELVANPEVPTTQPMAKIPLIGGDPPVKTLHDGDMYINTATGKLMIIWEGQRRHITFGPMSLVVPQISLQEYIDMVVMLLLVFGIAFQLPLIVAAVLKIGIFDADTLRASRKYVYFGLLIISAAITPGDFITATVALLVPLMILYELGIILGQSGKVEEEADEAAGDK